MLLSIKIRFQVLLFAAVLLAGSCNREKNPPLDVPSSYADFPDFYQRFHEDSAFQMAHIQFPLQGLPQRADSALIASDSFYWQKENWILHRPVDFSQSDFNREFTPVGENILIEYLIHKSGDFGMMRRWARLGNEWNLIYFADLNRITPAGIRIEQ